MGKDKSSNLSVTLLLLLSIVGLALIPVLVLQPNIQDFQVFNQRIVGILFMTVLLLGIAAAFYPTKCRGLLEKTQNPLPQAKKVAIPLRIRGHHPDCHNYSGNRIEVGGRVFCAACSGLLVGAIIALIGTAIHFFVGLNLAGGDVWLLGLGEIGMLLGLAQIKVAGFVKATLNAVFVAGSFATLAAADAVGKSLFVDLYAVGLILFLLWFRISLSEWNNKRTCRRCLLCFQ